MEIYEEFLEAYNDDLRRIGCSARVGDPGEGASSGIMEVLDQAGRPIGLLPDSIEAIELAVVLKVVEQAFERGIAEGQRLSVLTR